ncbi:MAG: hypothetical protein OXJ55_15675 [Caldilineaceae bacterium]|nr:hypothetical protein [Caldilineaceae bacterium]
MAASANWQTGIFIRAEKGCIPYELDDYCYPQSLEVQIMAEMEGSFYSPYTGETFSWAEDVDIEHIVARSEAHDSGLCAADTFTRLAFASDPLNLTSASPELNRDQKVDKDVAEWLPELNKRWFVSRVVSVMRRYGVLMDARKEAAALAVLESFPSFVMEIVAAEEAEPTAAEEVTPTPSSETEQQSGPQVEGDPLKLYSDIGRITCAEARRHGIAPVQSDHPAYQYMRNPDGDGVV